MSALHEWVRRYLDDPAYPPVTFAQAVFGLVAAVAVAGATWAICLLVWVFLT